MCEHGQYVPHGCMRCLSILSVLFNVSTPLPLRVKVSLKHSLITIVYICSTLTQQVQRHPMSLQPLDLEGDAIIDVLAHLGHGSTEAHVSHQDHQDHEQQQQTHGIEEQHALDSLVQVDNDNDNDAGADDGLDGWDIPALRAEIVRLRGLLVEMRHPEFYTKPSRKKKAAESVSHDERRKRAKGLRDQETGKRVDRGKRLELCKAIRQRVGAELDLSSDTVLTTDALRHGRL